MIGQAEYSISFLYRVHLILGELLFSKKKAQAFEEQALL